MASSITRLKGDSMKTPPKASSSPGLSPTPPTPAEKTDAEALLWALWLELRGPRNTTK